VLAVTRLLRALVGRPGRWLGILETRCYPVKSANETLKAHGLNQSQAGRELGYSDGPIGIACLYRVAPDARVETSLDGARRLITLRPSR
jgi:hypothetical protein